MPATGLPADELLPADQLLPADELLHALLLHALLLLQKAGSVQPLVPSSLLLLQHLLHQLRRELLQLTLAECSRRPVVRHESPGGSDARRTVGIRRLVGSYQPADAGRSFFDTLSAMRTTLRFPLLGLLVTIAMAAALLLGCEGSPPREEVRTKDKSDAKDHKAAESKKIEIGKNVVVEVLPNKTRRVLVTAEVCLREGQLEQLMCRKQTKEHESVLTADVDARSIHAALIAAQAKPGSPVRFEPKYRPASGSTIKVSVQFQDKDKNKPVTMPAQSWLKNAKTNKLLQRDWIFAGSRLVTNPLDPDKKIYLANDGDVICVSNFETALLDLPIKSPKENADLLFVANTERIPPLGTNVVVILEPVLEAEKENK